MRAKCAWCVKCVLSVLTRHVPADGTHATLYFLCTDAACVVRRQIRNKLILRAKFGQAMFQAILVGLIYRDLPHTQQSIQNRSEDDLVIFTHVVG